MKTNKILATVSYTHLSYPVQMNGDLPDIRPMPQSSGQVWNPVCLLYTSVWYWRYILYFINDGLIAFAHYFIYFSIPFVKNV